MRKVTWKSLRSCAASSSYYRMIEGCFFILYLLKMASDMGFLAGNSGCISSDEEDSYSLSDSILLSGSNCGKRGGLSVR